MSRRKLLIGAGYGLAALAILYALSPEPEPAPVSFEVAPAAEIASRARIERALDKHVKLHFEKTPIDAAIKQIAGKVGIPIRIDVRWLEDASIPANEPVTLDVSGVSLRSALDMLLAPHDLRWILKDETLLVTTAEIDGHEPIITVVYPVRDLVMLRTASGITFQYQRLIDLITSAINPVTSNDSSGPGSIIANSATGTLVVPDNRRAHLQIELLLTALRNARDAQGVRPGETITGSASWTNAMAPMGSGVFGVPAQSARNPVRPVNRRPPAPGRVSPLPSENSMFKRNPLIALCLVLAAVLAMYATRSQPALVSYEVISAAAAASHARYERALEKRVTFKFEELPLDQAIKQIADKIGLPIQIDEQALTDASLPPTSPISLDVSGITLRSALNLLLGRMDLTWILKDETLLVTTPEKAGNELIVVVYPVRDLVSVSSRKGIVGFSYQQLIDLLESAVAPTSWCEGNNCPIYEDRATGTLVVEQTREVHRQIELLLTALRKARDAQGIRPGETITNFSIWPWRPGMGGGTFVPPAPIVPQSAPTAQPKPTGNAGPPMTPTPTFPAPKPCAPMRST